MYVRYPWQKPFRNLLRSGGGKLGLIAISPLTPERMICLKEEKVVNNYFPGAISFEGRAYMRLDSALLHRKQLVMTRMSDPRAL